MKLNIEKWNAERIKIETEIKASKDYIRTPGRMPGGDEWAALDRLKALATRMYMLRAELRNRLHIKQTVKYVGGYGVDSANPGVTKKVVESYDRAQQLKWVTMGWQEEFLLPEPAAPESPTSDPSLQQVG